MIEQRLGFAAVIFFFLTFIHSSEVAAATPVTIYADNSYPPYAYQEGGEVKGLYTLILERAFSRMPDYQIDIQAVPWKRGLKLLESGRGFALYPPYLHLQERPYIWPYSLPIIDERVVLYCRQQVMNDSERRRWPEDYFGLTIGINAGFQLGGELFWQAVQEQKITTLEAKSNRASLMILGVGRSDCYMNDQLSIQLELARLKEEGVYLEGKHASLVEGAIITQEQGFLGYTDHDDGRFPFKTDFHKQLDAQLYQMRRSGELQQIIDSYRY